MVSVAINDHFYDFIDEWNEKFYFLVGGYGSSKSYHVAIKIIKKLLTEKRKALVVREVYDTHRDSTFSLFKEILDSMELLGESKRDKRKGKVIPKESPLKIDFPNGSEIIFKGMDKPGKLKSINGVSIIWVEECSEVKYEGIKELLGRLRHPTLKNHIIYSTNPVSKGNWSYKHFFIDKANKRVVLDDKELYKKRIIITNDTYYHHSVADDNFFLPEDYIKQLDEMKEYDPDLYRIARKGEFGTNGIKVLPQFKEMPSDWIKSAIKKIPNKIYRVGMDFGFETSYNAVVRMCIDDDNKDLYIYWCYYKNKMTDDRTAIDLEEFKETQELIRADSAEPKTIAYYQQEGFRMIGAKKPPGSRLQNTKKVKRFRHIYCSDECQPVIDELSELVYATDKDGEIIEDEFNIDPHSFSAMWYGLDGYNVADIKEQKYNKNVGKGINNNTSYNNDKRKRGGNVF